MRVLLVGGSGLVGSFITPYLREQHEIRVLDLRPPTADGVQFVEGSILERTDLERALDRIDVFVNLVMLSPQGGSTTDQTLREITENYAVNTLGLHLLLYTAQELGIKRGVHTSSMSVHYRERTWYPAEELVPLDTPSVYGLTKGFGEQICEYFCRWFDMNVLALRITGPRTAAQWRAERENPPVHPGGGPIYVTHEHDLARAYLSAIDRVQIGHGRFDAVFIAGDESEAEHNLSKAKLLLGWEPLAHRQSDGG